MTDQEFEAWLDDEHKKWAELMYQAVHDEAKMTEDEIKNARAQIPSLGIVSFRGGARAAWAKAQDEIENIKREVEMREHLFKHQADKLAEALKFYADKAKWAMDDRGNSLLDSNLWDDEEKLNSKTWVGGKLARQTLKEYRGEE